METISFAKRPATGSIVNLATAFFVSVYVLLLLLDTPNLQTKPGNLGSFDPDFIFSLLLPEWRFYSIPQSMVRVPYLFFPFLQLAPMDLSAAGLGNYVVPVGMHACLRLAST